MGGEYNEGGKQRKMASIRPAVEADNPIIRQMVRAEQLDPTSLKWQRFLVAEQDGKIIGIGQVKLLPGGVRELGSLVVLPEYRGQGVAGEIIRALEARSEFPLYLLCQQKNAPLYEHFGYRRIGWWDAPPFLKLKFLFPLMFRLFGIQVILMRKG